MNKRKDYAVQLGASLYKATKDSSELRQGHEQIYGTIADIDTQCVTNDAELAMIEQRTTIEAQASKTYRCPCCGTTVRTDQSFCVGCGKPIKEIIAETSTPQQQAEEAEPAACCISCGAPINPSDTFCMVCGARLDAAPAPDGTADGQPEEQPLD